MALLSSLKLDQASVTSFFVQLIFLSEIGWNEYKKVFKPLHCSFKVTYWFKEVQKIQSSYCPSMLISKILFDCTEFFDTVNIKSKLASTRREIIYCMRAILSLSSSKILTPHPIHPSPPGECVLPPTKAGGTQYTLAWRRGGWGVNILEDERDRIALLQ